MKIVKNSERVQRLQQGGQMATPMPQDPAMAPAAGGAVPQGEQDPLLMIAQIFAEGLQTQNCEMLAQGAQAFLQLLQQAQGGGAEPVGAPQGEPVFKKGGKLCGRKKKSVKKDACGGKVAKDCKGGSFKKCGGGTMKK